MRLKKHSLEVISEREQLLRRLVRKMKTAVRVRQSSHDFDDLWLLQKLILLLDEVKMKDL